MIARRNAMENYQSLGVPNGAEIQRVVGCGKGRRRAGGSRRLHVWFGEHGAQVGAQPRQ
jgi:hypothetical protein